MKIIKAAMIGAALAALTGCSSGPEATVKAFYNAIAEGDLTEARSYVHPSVLGMLGERKLDAVLGGEAERAQKCGGIKEMTVELTGEGEQRKGTVTIDYRGDCQTKTQNVAVRMHEGEWLIASDK